MKRYIFDEFILDVRQHALIRAEKKINIGSVGYKMLLYFVNNPNRTIQKQELVAHVWENLVVSDATVYKQIQRLRDLLNDNDENKRIIETIHGVGFEFLPEVNTAKITTAVAESKLTKTSHFKILTGVLAIIALIVLYQFKQAPAPSKVTQTRGISLYQAISNMKNAMVINKKAFISQSRIRNELGQMLDKRFHSTEKLSWERKFFKYYDKMNDEERFIYQQIRAYTDGPIYEKNQLLLDLINNNPDILKQIPLADELRSHLTIWLNKYNKVFTHTDKMALLYVGVEDGAPYPSEVDNQVTQWLQKHTQIADNSLD
jgi:DNA-binding winged helix-turn-helix (wHTH) protein